VGKEFVEEGFEAALEQKKGKRRHEVWAWVTERNSHKTAVHWRFTTANARIKLRHLYPRF
jgi:hypothetical protein